MITFVTGNANKLRETTAILGPLKSHSLDLPELQGTINDIAIAKALAAADAIQGPVIVEDTALSYDAMGELPGPYIKWFLKSLGTEGLYKMLAGFENKSAKAICTFAYCPGPGQEVLLFQGINPGRIVAPRGKEVFGWNPVFEPEGFDKTYAEMDDDTKNSISHRFLALEKLRKFFKENNLM